MRQGYTKLPARLLTREQFEAIRRAKDWTLTTTVEKAVQALAERERIELPGRVKAQRKAKTAAA